MAVTMAHVRAALDPEEPDYAQAAKLGQEALPHLGKLARDAEALLASKAVYLAALIQDERSVRIVRDAATRDDPVVRVAAAAAARYLPCVEVSEILLQLVNDEDSGVQRVALESARADATAELRASIERLTTDESDLSIQRSAQQVLGRISFGYQPDYGSLEEDASEMGSRQVVDSGMGSGSAVGMAQGGMGQRAHGSQHASGSMGQLGMGNADESTTAAWERAAAAWEKAAEAWEKKR